MARGSFKTDFNTARLNGLSELFLGFETASSPNALMDAVVRRSIELRLPLNGHFDLTYRCNERCVHCYLEHEDYGELTTEEVKSVLDQLARAGTLFLTFSGGEVFLRRDFFELARYARSLHFDLSLKTNGLLITRERAAELAALHVRRVQISIYSAEPSIHDAITKVPGSLERSLRAIRFLQECGLPVKIACPLMQLNLGGLEGVRRLADELGVPYVLDLTITPMINGNVEPLRLRLETRQLLPILSDRSLNPRVQLGAAPEVGAITLPEECSHGEEGFPDIPCSAGHNSFYISPYGDVYPCVQMPLPTGNLRQQGFEEIWYGSAAMNRVRAIRQSHLPTCSTCDIRRYCQRCPGQALMELGELDAPSPRACELAEATASLAGVKEPRSAWRSAAADTLPLVSQAGASSEGIRTMRGVTGQA
jgi:radical SAM protein with 4Fe4S-binding SPASM domain